MSRLPDTLLDISQLESGAVKPEPRDFKIAELFDALSRRFAGAAAGHGPELRVEPFAATAYADPAIIEQILSRLLANALEHTPQGRVTLRGRTEQGAIFLEVQAGGGAPRAAGQASGPPGALGPGLADVGRVVELLGLRLDLTPATEDAAVLCLRVPRGRSAPRAPRTQPAAPRPRHAGEVRVLLVEDDPLVRDATSMLLRVEGYGVIAVASLAEAVRSAEESGAPDLLITDYRLGNGELGTQVIAALRSRLGPNLKAVLVSGDATAAARELPNDPNLKIAGKPYKAQELLALLTALLSG
jgi:two-component system, sensor histidine kinase